VHESGLPFTDPSGDRLRQWLGVDYETFYADHRIGVAAQAFCYPGTAPKGKAARLSAAAPVRRAVAAPAAGRPAADGADPAGRRPCPEVGAGRSLRARHDRNGARTGASFAPDILPLPHPSWRNTAWLRKNPWFEEEIVPYLRQRVADILSS
jgi:uracil-DNA glycosylase